MTFQLESTAFTVTVNAAPAVCAVGAPVRPDPVAGAFSSPGIKICSCVETAAPPKPVNSATANSQWLGVPFHATVTLFAAPPALWPYQMPPSPLPLFAIAFIHVVTPPPVTFLNVFPS